MGLEEQRMISFMTVEWLHLRCHAGIGLVKAAIGDANACRSLAEG